MELINKIDGFMNEIDKYYENVNESSKQKFKIGDTVVIKDTGKKGKIIFIEDFDKILNQHIYSVELSNGKTESYVENDLKK